MRAMGVKPSSLARGDGAFLVEGRTQLAEPVGGCAGARKLVLREHHRIALALRDRHRDDLVVEAAGLLRRLGLLLGVRGKGVLQVAAKLILFRDVLGRDAHVIVVERIHETVREHGVYHLPFAHALTVARARHHVR